MQTNALKSSKAFFTELQDNVTSTLKSKSSQNKKRSNTDLLKHGSSAKRFKL